MPQFHTTTMTGARLHLRMSPYQHLVCHADDPFPDFLRIRFRVDDLGVDLEQAFGWSGYGRDLRCGRSVVRVLIHCNNHKVRLYVAGSPLQVVQGQNFLPMMNNVVLVRSFLDQVLRTLTRTLNPLYHGLILVEDYVCRIDLCGMYRQHSIGYRNHLHELVRWTLRLRQIASDTFKARTLYDNSVVQSSYNSGMSGKTYIKSAHPKYTYMRDHDPYERLECTVNGGTAPRLARLMGLHPAPREGHYSLGEILRYASDIHDAVISRLQLMRNQYKPERMTARSPVPDPMMQPAWQAWIRGAWDRSLYTSEQRTLVLRAYRAAGIDLAELPLPRRMYKRMRELQGLDLKDVFARSRRVRLNEQEPIHHLWRSGHAA